MVHASHTLKQASEETKRFFQKVYGWMFLGLMISGFTSFLAASSESFMVFLLTHTWLFIGLLILELVLVIGLVSMVKRMHSSFATMMFLLYSFVTGLTLSVIFLVYTIGSIQLVFFIAASMFGVMSIYGYFTDVDLTSMGQLMFMGLIGIIIASLINLFTRSDTASYIISFIGVIIFTGLTAYDTQKLKKQNILGNEGTDEDKKEAIMGALTLYLDFINLFLDLLRLFGKRR